MTVIKKLKVHTLRNLEQLSIQFHPKFNLIHGENGCGKTSILEAISFVGLGRSFRTRQSQRLIKHGKEKLSVYAELLMPGGEGKKVGVEWNKATKPPLTVSLGGDRFYSASVLAENLPIQVFNQDSLLLIDGGPKYRRQYVDWGVFHSDKEHAIRCQKYQQLLRQRNAGLKRGFSQRDLKVWDEELIRTGSMINSKRLVLLSELIPKTHELLADYFLPEATIELSFRQGWPDEQDLASAMASNFIKDRQDGNTQYGPHKANLRISINGQPIEHVLSRGQLKLFVFLLQIANVSRLQEQQNKKAVFLVDDLASELDFQGRKKVIEILARTQCQTVFTAIEKNDLVAMLADHDAGMFHVEQCLEVE